MNHSAELHLIIGCMFSGKSSELIKIINKYRLLEKKILAINHIFDKRYGSDKIISHDKNETSCLQLESLMSIVKTKDYKESEIIVIEEGHFFEDLDVFVKVCLGDNKTIYVAGLSGDYEMKPIGKILDLIPMANSTKQLSALCLNCKDGTKAHFSKRIVKDDSQILVGSNEYIPVCRNHFNK